MISISFYWIYVIHNWSSYMYSTFLHITKDYFIQLISGKELHLTTSIFLVHKMYGRPEYIDIITWLTQKMWDVIFHDSESQRELTPSPLEHTLDIDICKYKIPLERFCHQCQKAQFQLVLTQRHSDWWLMSIIHKKYIYFKNTCISELEKNGVFHSYKEKQLVL